MFESFSGIVKDLEKVYSGWEGSSQFEGTPRRLTSMFKEFCWSPKKIEEELDIHTRLFDEKYEEEISTSSIKVMTLCPHHLLPCELLVNISYKPNGKVLGLSKFARIAVIMGKRPIMQEMYTRELVNTLFERIKPNWIEVSVKGTHGCMKFRGPLQEIEICTSILREEN